MIDDDRLFFDALADEIRRRVLALLMREEELCVCELYQALDLPQPKVSRHLAVLRESGVVAVRRSGTWMHYRIAPHLPLWAFKILEYMAQGATAHEVFRQDARRLAAMSPPDARLAAHGPSVAPIGPSVTRSTS